jgi:AcrR family transcriptional regulator
MPSRSGKNSEDQRVKRTYGVLMEAFANLLAQKTYDEITVQELCEEAVIRRTTFYQHFENKQQFMEWFIRRQQMQFSEQSQEKIPNGQIGVHFEQLARKLLKYLNQNDALAKLAMDTDIRSQRLMDAYIRGCVENLLSRLSEKDELEALAGGAPMGLLAEFYVGGMLAALRWWIKNGRPCSEDELIHHLRMRVERNIKK